MRCSNRRQKKNLAAVLKYSTSALHCRTHDATERLRCCDVAPVDGRRWYSAPTHGRCNRRPASAVDRGWCCSSSTNCCKSCRDDGLMMELRRSCNGVSLRAVEAALELLSRHVVLQWSFVGCPSVLHWSFAVSHGAAMELRRLPISVTLELAVP